MTNSTLSTFAFIGAGAMVAAYAFKLLPIHHALLIAGGLIAIGFITQPSPNSAIATV